jgi:hypothetical protein
MAFVDSKDKIHKVRNTNDIVGDLEYLGIIGISWVTNGGEITLYSATEFFTIKKIMHSVVISDLCTYFNKSALVLFEGIHKINPSVCATFYCIFGSYEILGSCWVGKNGKVHDYSKHGQLTTYPEKLKNIYGPCIIFGTSHEYPEDMYGMGFPPVLTPEALVKIIKKNFIGVGKFFEYEWLGKKYQSIYLIEENFYSDERDYDCDFSIYISYEINREKLKENFYNERGDKPCKDENPLLVPPRNVCYFYDVPLKTQIEACALAFRLSPADICKSLANHR